MSGTSSFPKTRGEMLRAHYQFKSISNCKACDARIEWWRTTNGKNMPIDAVAAGDNVPITPHWSTCPKADRFRSESKAAAPAPTPQPAARRSNPEADLRALRAKHNARVAVLVLEDGSFAFWRNGIDAEDLRQDLIAAGNFVRAEIQKKETAPR